MFSSKYTAKNKMQAFQHILKPYRLYIYNHIRLYDLRYRIVVFDYYERLYIQTRGGSIKFEKSNQTLRVRSWSKSRTRVVKIRTKPNSIMKF